MDAWSAHHRRVTICFYLTVDHPKRPIDRHSVVERAKRFATHFDPTFYVIETAFPDARWFEPYLNRRPIRANRGAHRSTALDHVTWLALARLESGGRIGVLTKHADEPRPHAYRGTTPLSDVLESGGGWWEIDFGVVRFVYRGVEARLWSPVSIDGGQEAIGFLAEYEVCARSTGEADDAVRSLVADEGASCGVLPVPSIAGLADAIDPPHRVSGPVYFGRQ
jgi:hypothetical protein